jgi:uncharacterized protein (DUF58 family)
LETKELLKKVRKIEIKSRGLSANLFSGEYHSAFKGRGMSFSEVREYQAGDDIRTIDWNVTARLNHPYVKIYEEERELTMMLLIDVSQSGMFGTNQLLKQELITELCAVLSFSSLQNNDKIGVIFFSDQIEKFIPPKKGKTHVLRIIREMLEIQPKSKSTDLSLALKYLINVAKKRCTAFVISDFMDSAPFDDQLKIAAKKHDVIALPIQDQRETELPNMGLARFVDMETGHIEWIDTSSRTVRKQYAEYHIKRQAQLKSLFNRSGVDFATLQTDRSYVNPIINLFKRRNK